MATNDDDDDELIRTKRKMNMYKSTSNDQSSVSRGGKGGVEMNRGLQSKRQAAQGSTPDDYDFARIQKKIASYENPGQPTTPGSPSKIGNHKKGNIYGNKTVSKFSVSSSSSPRQQQRRTQQTRCSSDEDDDFLRYKRKIADHSQDDLYHPSTPEQKKQQQKTGSKGGVGNAVSSDDEFILMKQKMAGLPPSYKDPTLYNHDIDGYNKAKLAHSVGDSNASSSFDNDAGDDLLYMKQKMAGKAFDTKKNPLSKNAAAMAFPDEFSDECIGGGNVDDGFVLFKSKIFRHHNASQQQSDTSAGQQAGSTSPSAAAAATTQRLTPGAFAVSTEGVTMRQFLQNKKQLYQSDLEDNNNNDIHQVPTISSIKTPPSSFDQPPPPPIQPTTSEEETQPDELSVVVHDPIEPVISASSSKLETSRDSPTIQKTRPWYRNRNILSFLLTLTVAIIITVTITLSILLTRPPEEEDSAERYATIQTELSNVSSTKLFSNPLTPQYQALQWIVHTDTMKLTAQSPNLDQRYILVLLYYSMNGLLWLLHEDWLTGTDECDWQHVVCDSRNSIVTIDLNHMNVQRNMPSEIGSLHSLQNLDMANNKIEGSIPTEIGLLSSSLLSLKLSNNEFTGVIPSELFVMKSLVNLELDDAFSVNTRIESLSSFDPIMSSSLNILDLQGNRITGSIPTFIGSLTSLQELRLNRNDFNGVIPTEFAALINLVTLALDYNTNISGSIPLKFCDLKSLEGLHLNSNGLSGVIPNCIGNLTSLQVLDLDSNGLGGTIPTNIGHLTALQALSLNTNRLTGTIPTEIGNLKALRKLTLISNQLTGSMPLEICSLPKLSTFNFDTYVINSSCDPKQY